MHDYVVADVFTDEPLSGNPVAVFLDAAGFSTGQMQRLARELNLSETTFVLPPRDGGDVRVRIFTPVNELPFAGHPTLGTAIVLGMATRRDRLLMETAMSTVPFVFDRGPDGGIRSARMRQPVPTWEPYEEADDLLAALGVRSSVLPVEVYRNGPRHVFVGLGGVAELSAVEPDLRALARHPDMAANCFAGSGGTWRTRMFSPAYGVAEDAATGSAAGPLAIHLARHGLIPFGRRIEIRQGVEMGRPSTMFATATATALESAGAGAGKGGGEGEGLRVDTVEVAGSAVVVARGTYRV